MDKKKSLRCLKTSLRKDENNRKNEGEEMETEGTSSCSNTSAGAEAHPNVKVVPVASETPIPREQIGTLLQARKVISGQLCSQRLQFFHDSRRRRALALQVR